MIELDKFHHYEVLDRTHVIQNMVSDHLQGHRANSKKMNKRLEKVQKLLGKVYQKAGERMDKCE